MEITLISLGVFGLMWLCSEWLVGEVDARIGARKAAVTDTRTMGGSEVATAEAGVVVATEDSLMRKPLSSSVVRRFPQILTSLARRSVGWLARSAREHEFLCVNLRDLRMNLFHPDRGSVSGN